jgi:muramidase (phage lysozyme)
MTRCTTLPTEARAFLDALAVGESGGADDDAAYSVLFGGGHFVPAIEHFGIAIIPATGKISDYLPWGDDWPKMFPQWSGVWIHGVPTHAAGRYQFEPATWREQQQRLSLPDFSPVSQDLAAWDLAERVVYRGAPSEFGGLLKTLISPPSGGTYAQIASVLKSTWSSLDHVTFPARYREALARYQGGGNVMGSILLGSIEC